VLLVAQCRLRHLWHGASRRAISCRDSAMRVSCTASIGRALRGPRACPPHPVSSVAPCCYWHPSQPLARFWHEQIRADEKVFPSHLRSVNAMADCHGLRLQFAVFSNAQRLLTLRHRRICTVCVFLFSFLSLSRHALLRRTLRGRHTRTGACVRQSVAAAVTC
jgi:hypothetical protein